MSLPQAAHADCGARTPVGRYAGNQGYSVGGALFYSTPQLKVDADGAPDAYRVDGKGLSYTCDGMVAVVDGVRYTHNSHPNTWQPMCNAGWAEARRTGDYSSLDIFGFETKNGVPVVQGTADPLPGEAFITTTTVTIPGQPAGSQRSYVNSSEIPFIVLPSGFVSRNRVRNGAVAAVYRPRTGRLAFAVYGDSGGALNEASVRLHSDLGSNPMILRNGTQRAKRNIDDLVAVVVFPNVAPSRVLDATAWRTLINSTGQSAFAEWGGLARLKDCAGIR